MLATTMRLKLKRSQDNAADRNLDRFIRSDAIVDLNVRFLSKSLWESRNASAADTAFLIYQGNRFSMNALCHGCFLPTRANNTIVIVGRRLIQNSFPRHSPRIFMRILMVTLRNKAFVTFHESPHSKYETQKTVLEKHETHESVQFASRARNDISKIIRIASDRSLREIPNRIVEYYSPLDCFKSKDIRQKLAIHSWEQCTAIHSSWAF